MRKVKGKMSKFIDAEKLKKHYSWWKDGTDTMTLDEAMGVFNTIVDVQPAADVAEVKHGRWEDGKRMGLDGTFHWFRQCSECLYEREDDNEDKDTPYCPNCGSRMDLDEVEE